MRAAVPVLLGGALLAGVLPGEAPAAAATVVPAAPAPLAAMARAIEEAERGLGAHELQIAESRFRSALVEGWLVRGALDVADGRLDDAAESFRRAAASSAETRRARVSLAAVHLRRGEPGEAVTILRRVAGAAPADGAARRLLAQALVVAGEPEEAVQELEEGYAATGDPETAFALATGYLRLDRPERAERLFAELAAARPAPETWVLIGRTYRDYQHHERARAALETALAIDPAARRANLYLGTVDLLERGLDGSAAALERLRAEVAAAPGDPIARLYLGLVLSQERRFEEAVPHLEAAAGWPPIRLDALRYLGRCLLGGGRVDEAVEVLRAALDAAALGGARPRQLESAHYQLAQALRRQGREAEAAEHFAAAETRLSEVVADERDELALLIAGETELERSGKTAAPLAVPSLEGLAPPLRGELRAEVETALARVYLNLGVAHLRGGRFDRALAPLEAAEGLAPELPRLQRSLGAARWSTGRFEAAVRSLEQALAAEPGDLELTRMLALSHLGGGDPARAAELLAADPGRAGDRGLAFAYGLALVRAGRAAEAEAEFGRLLAEHGDWAELHVVLGQAHARQGDFDAAVAELERALALDPGVPEASFTLGDLYLRQGRLAEAAAALEAELAVRPEDLRARYHLAVVLDLDRRPERAIEELGAVLAARPDHADARYLLGKIRLAQGAAEEASAHLEAAAALAPDDANIRYQLAQAYQRSGRPELADRQLELYRELKRRDGDAP